MPTMTFIDNNFASLWYHPEHKIIHHKFHKFLYGQAFRDVLSEGLEVMKKHGANKWLSDDRNNTVMTKEDTEWAITVWSPQAMQAGWKYWAIVQPEKILAKMDMEKFAKMYAEQGVMVQFFTDPEEAMTWLESL